MYDEKENTYVPAHGLLGRPLLIPYIEITADKKNMLVYPDGTIDENKIQLMSEAKTIYIFSTITRKGHLNVYKI